MFEDKALALAEQRDMAAVARATQEIQAALVIGKRFPRNEVSAKAKILEACKRKGLAEVAEYEYSRGGNKITGPTIDLLRAIASRWGNLLYGWQETERTGAQSAIRCWAWDTQSNARAERTFIMKHWRDTAGGGYELDDERDIYELIANMAARRVRACLEEVIDSDIVEDAVNQCRETLRTGEKTPLVDRVVKMVDAFKKFGVTQNQIEVRLGNKAEAISENQLASLRRIYKSLSDGVGTPQGFFKPEVQASAPAFEGQPPAAGAPPTAPAPTPPVAPAPEAAPTPPPEPENHVLKEIRNLLGLGKYKESELLALPDIPPGTRSLEELLLTYPEYCTRLLDNFGNVAAAIRTNRKKEKEK